MYFQIRVLLIFSTNEYNLFFFFVRKVVVLIWLIEEGPNTDFKGFF